MTTPLRDAIADRLGVSGTPVIEKALYPRIGWIETTHSCRNPQPVTLNDRVVSNLRDAGVTTVLVRVDDQAAEFSLSD